MYGHDNGGEGFLFLFLFLCRAFQQGVMDLVAGWDKRSKGMLMRCHFRRGVHSIRVLPRTLSIHIMQD